MVIEAVCDREIIPKIDTLFAYQRDAPIIVRITSPIVTNTGLTGKTFIQKINDLRTHKGARVILIVNTKDAQQNTTMSNYLQELEDIGVKIHYRNKIHAKIILVEGGNDKGLLLTTSNFTRRGLHVSRETGIYFLNERIDIYDKIKRWVINLIKEPDENEE